MIKTENSANNITIYDIAKIANCSAATVSLALRDDQRISIKTRDLVKESAESLGYKPNYFAKALKDGKTYTIAVIVPDLTNPVFAEIISGIEEYLVNKGYHTIIGVTNMNLAKEKYYLNIVDTQRVDGIIFMPTFINELADELRTFENNSFPFVLSGVSNHHLNLNSVTSNMVDGAFMAVEHLINKGHKNIAFISGETSPSQSFERIAGYRKALEHYKIPFNPEYIVKSDQSVSSVRKATDVFLKNHKEITALFCLYDFVAMAAIKAAYDNKLHIPNDIAIIGYDNISLDDYSIIGLTSVDPKNKKIGETSAKMILNIINKKQSKLENIILSPLLVLREST